MSSAVSTVARSTSHPHLPSPASSWAYAEYPRKHIPPAPFSLQKVQRTSLANEAALHGGGLRTPPAEDGMGTTYQHNPVLSSTYDSHVALARQPNGLAQAGRPGVSLCDAALNQMARPQPVPVQQHLQPQAQPQFPHQQQQQQQQHMAHPQPPSHLQQVHHASSLAPPSTASRHSTRPSTPSSTTSTSQHHEGTVSRRDSTLVMHSLQLPACISINGGNLSDFAALMTCFFWFENMETIDAAEQVKERPTSSAVPPLTSDTRPCPAYKKWVHTILTTTQVTQNVILLALLFVYRLKSTNPKVNGSPGSEYRLLTVALMLGNKFLDDNTYTNKTWAEVSGIAVKEIHVMEVEFLSNMRYGLLTSKEQWADWLKKLSCFHDYCERAERTERATVAELARRQRASNLQANTNNGTSPTHRGFSPPLPSPTRTLPPAVQGTPAPLTAYSPNSAVYHSNQWQGQGPFQSTPALSPLAAKPSMGYPESRKRSLEGSEMMEPAAKRVTRQTPAPMPSGPVQPTQAATESVRLPVPRLALDTQSVSTPAAYGQPSNYPQATVSLPPLGANVRAMATVYPNATTTWAPQVPIAATCGPQTPAYAPTPSNFGTPTKRHSPRGLAIYSSPLADAYNGHHTPIANSPSVFLQQRNSPYKPLRPVNTLNYPPPSSSLSEYHLGSAQMHYQPLGHRNVRTGIVPEFLPGYGNARPTPVPTSQAPGQHYHA